MRLAVDRQINKINQFSCGLFVTERRLFFEKRRHFDVTIYLIFHAMTNTYFDFGALIRFSDSYLIDIIMARFISSHYYNLIILLILKLLKKSFCMLLNFVNAQLLSRNPFAVVTNQFLSFPFEYEP